MSAEKRHSTDYATGLQKESLASSNLNNSNFSHYIQNQADLLPTCNKISAFLNEFGYVTVQLISSDVNAESNSISVFVLESWASAILTSIEELGERLNNQKNAVKDAAVSKRLVEVNKETLNAKIRELQSKLVDTEKREKLLESKLRILEDSKSEKSKSTSSEDIQTRKTVKNLELQIQESERRGRQKEVEMEKLKQKLMAVAEKEKETAAKNRQIFTQYKQGDISFASDNRSFSNITPIKSSNANTPRSAKSIHHTPHSAAQHNSSMNTSNISMGSVLEALEEQRAELSVRNKELELQVIDLLAKLKDVQNRLAASHRVDHNQHNNTNKRINSSSSNTKWRKHHNTSEDSEGGNDSFEANEEEEEEEMSPVAQQMFDKIQQQAAVIESLRHRAETAKESHLESENEAAHLRGRIAAMRDDMENLRLEMETRPSVKQWTQTQREMAEMEDTLRDLTVMRGDSKEIAMWRKHLSTHDRIKVDKRNHELGLWLLDSLPKTVMKEVLQAVCRELDVTDISDIQQCVAKLKAVVKTVPRLERFVSQVCSFVFERDSALDQLKGRQEDKRQGGSSMEDVFPKLKRWWQVLQLSHETDQFNDQLLQELHRREHMIAHIGDQRNRHGNHDRTAQQLSQQWEAVGRLQWTQRDPRSSVQIVRELVDFQLGVLTSKANLLAAEEYIKERPDVLVNRIVGHLQYLFEIKTLDGVLPRMNQVYLFTEEMRNFLATARAIVGQGGVVGAGNGGVVPNAILLAEIERRLTVERY